MIISITKERLIELIVNQVNNLFGFNRKEQESDLLSAVEATLGQIEHCFSFRNERYYRKDNELFFDPFHASQYAIFLYYLSRSLFEQNENRLLADKVYYLNRALNSVDLYYEVKLPSIFGLDHPLGSVIGRAEFSDFFFFTQNCTVGNNKGIYPVFGKNVAMLAGSTVIGNSHISDNCIISANSYIKDQDVPGNSLVFGVSPELVIKQRDESYFWENSWFFPEGLS